MSSAFTPCPWWCTWTSCGRSIPPPGLLSAPGARQQRNLPALHPGFAGAPGPRRGGTPGWAGTGDRGTPGSPRRQTHPLLSRGLPGLRTSRVIAPVEDGGDVLSGHAVEVKMKAAGWFTLGRNG
jgi:hypothetical protein